jgi:transcription elongation GreA/GreB family factor
MRVQLPPPAPRKMDKKIIIEKIIKRLKKRLKSLEKSIQETQKAVISAPSAMQSWSDTSRFQFRSQIAKLQPQATQLKNCIKKLQKLDVSRKPEKAELGVLIKIKKGDKILFYFICPPGSGAEILKLNKSQVTAISVNSPLAQKILNKKVGDKIKLEDQKRFQQISILQIS